MAVLLSPVGGVAGQFFDNNGNPLTGGKMYSYVAGTTTPQATYTSSAGTVAHSNPIILDAGGRVPGGEIWLTDGLQYKFVLKNANDVLIGTYDNIIGINSNFVNFLTETEVQTATAGQTVFTLTTMQYQPGTNNLSVFVDGVNQIDGSTYSYVETSSTVITFTAGLHVGALVKFTTAQTLSTGVTDASLVTYTPAGTGAVTTTVQTKLRESVSATEYGANDSGLVATPIPEADALTVAESIRSFCRSLWMYKFPKRGLKTWKRTFGTKDQAAVVSISAGQDTTEPVTQVLGFNTDSDVSVYADRDSVALFVQAQAMPALVTTAVTTFTATSVTSAAFATAIAANQIFIGMLIDTNESPKKTGVIDGVNAGTNTLSVSAWYIVDGTRNMGTPANGVTVYVNPNTKTWALNANVLIDATSQANSAVGFELGLVNDKSANIGYLYDAVNLGTYAGLNAFQSRGSWNAGFATYIGCAYGFTAASTTAIGYYSNVSVTGFQSDGATNNAFVAKNANTAFLVQDSAENVLSYVDGAGAQNKFKVKAVGYTASSTINADSVLCIGPVVTVSTTINLPSPSGLNAQRVLFLKNPLSSTATIFFAGVVEGGGGSIAVTAGKCVQTVSDGSSWIPVSN